MKKMAGVSCFAAATGRRSHMIALQQRFNTRNIRGPTIIRCLSTENNNKKETPRILKLAVSGVTELLRLFSLSNDNNNNGCKKEDELSVTSVDDVIDVLKSDYDNAYFVTGIFTSDVYAEDCLFEDPTIRFRGRDVYAKNLRLLVPFFDSPSITLQNIEKVNDPEARSVLAKWKLRTYLKLPWRPLISIDGSTVYELNEEYSIVRHAESWNVSALEAIGQIFKPSSR